MNLTSKTIKSFFYVAGSFLIVFTLLVNGREALSAATPITLTFNTLPSGQGWTYSAVGNSASEGRVFSVNAGTLFQNSIGLGPAGGGHNQYVLNGVVTQAPFVLFVRARVPQEERFPSSDPNNHYGFAFTVSTGTEIFGMGLGTNTIEDENFRTFTQDNTQFHDYRLEGMPGVGYRFFVDGQLLATGSSRVLSEPNGLSLGDNTGGTNARAEVTSYSFTTVRPAASVSAASFKGEALANESIIAAFGTDLAPSIQSATTLPLPTSLAGTTVKVLDSTGTERFAPLFFVAPTQVNYQIPQGTVTGDATVTITSGNGVPSGGRVRIATVAPGLFSANSNGQGVAAGVALRVKADGAQIYESITRFDQSQNKFVSVPIDLRPESDQVFLVLSGTGIRFRSGLSGVTALIGGSPVEVLYAGAQGVFVGLDQVNLRLPPSLIGRGEVDIVLSVDGAVANVVRIAIK